MSSGNGEDFMPIRRWLISLLALNFLLLSIPAKASLVIESVNEALPPVFTSSWLVEEIGWLYTPALNYSLTGVNTKFGSGVDSRTVTIEVFDDAPVNGGNLLGTTTFNPLASMFAGGDFSTPISFIAGNEYFVGFKNVMHLSVNTTLFWNATTFLDACFSFPEDPSGYHSCQPVIGSNSHAPILQFETRSSTVPTPAVFPLMLISLAGIALLRMRRSTEASEKGAQIEK